MELHVAEIIIILLDIVKQHVRFISILQIIHITYFACYHCYLITCKYKDNILI